MIWGRSPRAVVVRWVDTTTGPIPHLPPHPRPRPSELRVETGVGTPVSTRSWRGWAGALARDLLRLVAAEALGAGPTDPPGSSSVDPAAVAVEQRCPRCGGPHGPPEVVLPDGTRRWASISYARPLVAVALALDHHRVGLDVTARHDHRSPQSPAHLAARTWVRLEATVKTTGAGLGPGIVPERIDVGPPDQPPRLRSWPGPGPRPTLRLADLEVPEGFVAAVGRTGRGPLAVDARPWAPPGPHPSTDTDFGQVPDEPGPAGP